MAIGKLLGFKSVPGASYIQQLTVQGDANSYTTNGIPLAPSDFGFNNSIDIAWVVVRGVNAAALWAELIPNASNNGYNLRLIVSSTGSELANAGSSAGSIFDIYALGR